jgi:tetratricopeptide (TPR) repeat protein
MHESERLGFEYLAALVRGDRLTAYRVHQRYPQIAPGGLAHWALANTALGVNRPRETIEVSLQLDPERGELRGWYLYWRELGRAYHMLGEHDEELRIARHAASLFPTESMAAVSEIRVFAALGRNQDVQRLLEAQLPGDPGLPWLRQQAAIELLAHGFDDAARGVLRGSVDAVAPMSGLFNQLLLAQSYSLLGRHDESYRVLRDLAARAPDLIAIQGALGSLAARRDQREEAERIAAWLEGLDRPFLHGANTYWKARIAAQLGNREEAVLLLHRAVREGFSAWDDLHREPDLAPLRDYQPFRELLRPKG